MFVSLASFYLCVVSNRTQQTARTVTLVGNRHTFFGLLTLISQTGLHLRLHPTHRYITECSRPHHPLSAPSQLNRTPSTPIVSATIPNALDNIRTRMRATPTMTLPTISTLTPQRQTTYAKPQLVLFRDSLPRPGWFRIRFSRMFTRCRRRRGMQRMFLCWRRRNVLCFCLAFLIRLVFLVISAQASATEYVLAYQ